jgi:hypothetical protein
VALPQLTAEQRAENLKKAAAARTARTELKKKLKGGELTLAQVFEQADKGDDIAGKTKVVDLIKALPGVGKVKADALMEQLEIQPTRRAGGLGSKQRAALLAEFSA